MSLGVTDLPEDYKWPSLTFGWTLADVIKNTNAIKQQLALQNSNADITKPTTKEFTLPEAEQKTEPKRSPSPLLVDGNEELGDLSTKLLDKLNKGKLRFAALGVLWRSLSLLSLGLPLHKDFQGREGHLVQSTFACCQWFTKHYKMCYCMFHEH